jgi:hypothetical protein
MKRLNAEGWSNRLGWVISDNVQMRRTVLPLLAAAGLLMSGAVASDVFACSGPFIDGVPYGQQCRYLMCEQDDDCALVESICGDRFNAVNRVYEPGVQARIEEIRPVAECVGPARKRSANQFRPVCVRSRCESRKVD